MNEGVLNAIENIVDIIYTPDQNNIAEAFGLLADSFGKFVEDMAAAGYTVDISNELIKVQDAFKRKDYVLLSDILLYEVKPEFETLEV